MTTAKLLIEYRQLRPPLNLAHEQFIMTMEPDIAHRLPFCLAFLLLIFCPDGCVPAIKPTFAALRAWARVYPVAVLLNHDVPTPIRQLIPFVAVTQHQANHPLIRGAHLMAVLVHDMAAGLRLHCGRFVGVSLG